MTATTSNVGDGSQPKFRAGGDSAEPSTGLLAAAPTADRCQTCGAELAVDQRYCVECGTRRGRARFALPGPAAAQQQPSSQVVVASGGPFTRTTALLAVLVVLVALGVGVLIGHGTTPHVTLTTGGSTTSNTGGASHGGRSSSGNSSSGNSSSAPKSATTSSGNFFSN